MTTPDVLIIGAGIGGLTCALRTAEHLPHARISVLCKGKVTDSNSYLAQGGIAAVVNGDADSIEQHVTDTMMCGSFRNNSDVVRFVVNQAPATISWLQRIGVHFDKEGANELHVGVEGGHSKARIVHSADHTGRVIMRALMRAVTSTKNIRLIENTTVVDLLTEVTGVETERESKTECAGCYTLNTVTGRRNIIESTITVLATGGSGRMFEVTSNPDGATGDGVALAHRIGAKISDMQLVQFHPTVLYETGSAKRQLITEALRGAGAFITNSVGRRFLFDYDARGELAPRHVVSAAIEIEQRELNVPYVFLDCRHLERGVLESHFRGILYECVQRGYDLYADLVPVTTAAHYQTGGVKVDGNGLTNVGRLYACGECTHTGMHGNNRLASNSLLESVVYANQIANNVATNLSALKIQGRRRTQPSVVRCSSDQTSIQPLLQRIRRLMTQNVGVLKTEQSVWDSKMELQCINDQLDQSICITEIDSQQLALVNTMCVATLITQQSIDERKVSSV